MTHNEQKSRTEKKKTIEKKKKTKKTKEKSNQVVCTSRVPQQCNVPMPQQTMSQHYRFAKP